MRLISSFLEKYYSLTFIFCLLKLALELKLKGSSISFKESLLEVDFVIC
jgi:hypothetical protein